MARTLLIGGPGADWSVLRGDVFLSLDPDDATLGHVGRLAVFDQGRPRDSRFFGSRNALRAPQTILAMLGLKRDAEVVQTFAHRHSPLSRQVLQLIGQVYGPNRILIDVEAQLPISGWPVPAEGVHLERISSFAQETQRKAQWLALFERCQRHEVQLSECSFQGCRLGSGQPVTEQFILQGASNVLYAELQGQTLFAVETEATDERKVTRLLDDFHASKWVSTSPDAYADLFCACARSDGEDLGYGRIESIDFESRVAVIWSEVVAGTPIPLVKVGTLRVDADGREHEELGAWSA